MSKVTVTLPIEEYEQLIKIKQAAEDDAIFICRINILGDVIYYTTDYEKRLIMQDIEQEIGALKLQIYKLKKPWYKRVLPL